MSDSLQLQGYIETMTSLVRVLAEQLLSLLRRQPVIQERELRDLSLHLGSISAQLNALGSDLQPLSNVTEHLIRSLKNTPVFCPQHHVDQSLQLTQFQLARIRTMESQPKHTELTSETESATKNRTYQIRTTKHASSVDKQKYWCVTTIRQEFRILNPQSQHFEYFMPTKSFQNLKNILRGQQSTKYRHRLSDSTTLKTTPNRSFSRFATVNK